MQLRILLVSSLVSVATALAAPVSTAKVHQCVPGNPTAASYTWDFKGEANTIFQQIQADAQQALDHADELQSLGDNQQLSWDTHVEQLDALKQKVNDMSERLCRLEMIRRVTAPWQRAEIDRIANTVRLMVDNTQDAITFGAAHQNALWVPTYQRYADNLYNESLALTRSVDNAVAYARTAKEYRSLRQELGMRPSS